MGTIKESSRVLFSGVNGLFGGIPEEISKIIFPVEYELELELSETGKKDREKLIF